MTHRISALISAFGVLGSTLLLVVAFRDYHSGASVLWLGAGALLFLGASYTFARDVRGHGRRAS
ncbi:hypothetical protein [Streptomyces atroolivaceus]|uniref:hypothetical protein n=1 Tax=Streptomyces atroolivaceus TaxID=66869 RepID=UPI0034317D7F